MDSEIIRHLEEQSRIGDIMLDISKNCMPMLEEHILRPMEWEAFRIFQTVDPNDPAAVIEPQMMGKIVTKIRTVIAQRIEEGKLARMQIKNLSTQEEDDNNG